MSMACFPGQRYPFRKDGVCGSKFATTANTWLAQISLGDLAMATVLRLTVLTGPHKNEKFCFCGPPQCWIGRAGDFFVQLSGTARDEMISRHHCELIMKPPLLTFKDMASQNGTYLN